MNSNVTSKRQRALVLGGGGALGAYEAGVIKVLCKKIIEDDKKNGENDRLLFDIVAGTSIGAMNAAVLVGNVVKRNKTWSEAAEELVGFWTNEKSDDKKGLASTVDYSKWWWDEALKNKSLSKSPTDSADASTEAARRYYSVKEYWKRGTPNVCSPPIPKPDFKFADLDNMWFTHDNTELQKTISSFTDFPIATKFEEKQPRLLVFSVDVAEGQTVTFDSYPKPDGSRRSEYGKYDENLERYQYVIKYPGITMEHVMASGTLPEFYDYAKVRMNVENGNEKSSKSTTVSDKQNEARYFWDGGLLSNTPFRELLEAHVNYWMHTQGGNGIVPDLEVYIVNLHPPKQPHLPNDHDGVKDRLNDILFFDRSSHYDENIARLVSDYKNFIGLMNDLAKKAFSKINTENDKVQLQNELENILTTHTSSKDNKDNTSKYEDLIKGQFNLSKVVRIEHTNYTNSISGKVSDFTAETIRQLIEEGERDAWISLIQDDIKHIEMCSPDDIDLKNSLIDKLNSIRASL